jgi:hypothetical protein
MKSQGKAKDVGLGIRVRMRLGQHTYDDVSSWTEVPAIVSELDPNCRFTDLKSRGLWDEKAILPSCIGILKLW